MKHLLIFGDDFNNTNPLKVQGIVFYDSNSKFYNSETKGYIENFPAEQITYVDVEDSVNVNLHYSAKLNTDGSWTFTKP
jgi:hypothetical protein